MGRASVRKHEITMHQFIEQIYRDNKKYKGIIFLDRDGTINEEVNYLSDKIQIEILPKVIEGIRLLNKNKITVIIITNQPVVARGYITIDEVKEINDTLVEILQKENAYIDAIYSCPHHPQRDPNIPTHAMKYRVECDCRKPGLAMHKKALSIYDSKKVLGVVGDQTKDILAGKKLKTQTVIVKTGYKGEDGLHDVIPDFVCDNFLDAVRALLKP